jgi:hypothetical protein
LQLKRNSSASPTMEAVETDFLIYTIGLTLVVLLVAFV